MIPGVGTFELLVIMILAVVLFGGKLPEVARNVGKSYNQFRAGLNDLKSNMNSVVENTNIDTMPRHEKIRHYSDVDPLPAKTSLEDELPLFAPPKDESPDV